MGRIATVLMLLLVFGAARAGETETPADVVGARVIDRGEAKRLLDGNAATFIDVRVVFNYGKEHIPGAIWIPYHQESAQVPGFDPRLDRFELAQLPADKSRPLVFYSHGRTGWKSYKAVRWAVAAGYRQVLWFRDGLDAWREAGYPLE